MSVKHIASVLLAVVLGLTLACSRRVESVEGGEIPATRSVETVAFVSNGTKWYRTWDLETGVVCYRRGPRSESNSCAYTPSKPYPLRDDKEDGVEHSYQ